MNTLHLVRSCYCISIRGLGVFLLAACAIENNIPYLGDKEMSNLSVTRSASGVDIPDDVFSYEDVRLTPVVTTLQAIESEIHFMEAFCELYGVPLWDYAEIEEEGNLTCCYVPLFDQNAPLRINTIWFFSVENDRMSYMPIRRQSESIVGSGQEFLFDALSSVIFGESGSSRVFKKHAQTRSWISVTTCFDVYTGNESIGMTYQYTECYDKLI